MDVETVLRRCGGAARWSRLRHCGASERSIRAAVAAGRVIAVGHGGYALPDADAGLVAAVRLRGLASHGTAARLHGLALWRPVDGIDVTVRPGSRPHAPSVRLHRALVRPDEIDVRLSATNLLRTAIDCGRTMPLIDAAVVLNSALQNGRVKLADLRAAAESARGHGAVELRRAVDHADELAGSPLESALRPWLMLLGVRLRSQFRIRGVPGGPVDFVLNGWLVVEADGFEFHRERADYRKDRARANALAVLGFTLLRFTYEDVRGRPWWVLAQVQAVLDRGPVGPRSAR